MREAVGGPETGSGPVPTEVVLALDAGTTGVRAIAFDHRGLPVCTAYRELTQHFPRPGWVEHDADEILALARAVLAETTEQLAGLGRRAVALGITNQRETAVAWDRRSGRPRARAIVWQDRRTATHCEELTAAGHLPLVRRRTGLGLDPYFTATKLHWLLTEGELEADDDLAVGTVDAWLVWHLSGGPDGGRHATDVTNASRTLLLDLATLQWDPELCDLFGVPLAALPDVVPSSGRIATVVAGNGVEAGLPVSGVAGDQQAALFGQACFDVGMTKATYGTGSFVLLNAGERCPEPVDGLLTTVAWQLGDQPATYAYEGAVFVTGAAIQWLRDGLGTIAAAPEVGPLAESVADSGGVVVVPAFTGLGSPWWDPWARGTILGLTRGIGRAHIARAVVESIALQVTDVVDAMSTAAGVPVAAVRADGGAAAMDLLLRLQADLLGVTVSRPTVTETTALGAAYLAGLAEGFWPDLDAVTKNWAVDAAVPPEAGRTPVDALRARWASAVQRSRSWADEGDGG